jgi:hypothetical protein
MTQHMLAVDKSTPAYSIIEVLPGLCLIVLRTESAADVAAKWAAFLDETERRPNMADEPTPDEAAMLDEWANGDPHLARWTAYNVQPDYMRDGYIGD